MEGVSSPREDSTTNEPNLLSTPSFHQVPIIVPIIFLICEIVLIAIPLLTQEMANIIGGILVMAVGVVYYGIFVLWKNKPRAYKAWVGK